MPDHLPHLEDLMVLEGREGFEKAVHVLDELTHGHTEHFSVKYDGAPAVFFGTDPSDGKKFVAKKSILNKKPIVYKNHEDVDAHVSNPVLAEKLKRCFDVLPEIRGCVQAELLFSSQSEVDPGPTHLYVMPNIIRYGFLNYTRQSDDVLRAEVGIIPHSYYLVGENLSLTPIKMSLNSLEGLSSDVFIMTPELSLGGHSLLYVYNHLIDRLKYVEPPREYDTKYFNGFIKALDPLPRRNEFESLYREVSSLKDAVLENASKCDKDYWLSTDFIHRDGDVTPTWHEGLVYDDGVTACKLVDRRKFSYVNFSPDFRRGWSLDK